MAKEKEPDKKEEKPAEKPMCGIVMPISAIDDCSEGHWNDVRVIIEQSIMQAEFIPNLVSNADEVGVIQKNIIQNLYEYPIAVVDVSCKNPNVMFELGLRLAFDKPTIIIKDDRTNYSFDTASIEHIPYPRDLRFNKIVEFKEKLTEKIFHTHKKAVEDPAYSTFLKHFGSFKVAKITTEEVTKEDLIMERLKTLEALILRNSREESKLIKGYSIFAGQDTGNDYGDNYQIHVECTNYTLSNIRLLVKDIKDIKGVKNVEAQHSSLKSVRILINLDDETITDNVITNISILLNEYKVIGSIKVFPRWTRIYS